MKSPRSIRSLNNLTLLCTLLVIGGIAAPNLAGEDKSTAGWIEIFSGKDLSGWTDKTGDWQVVGEVPLNPENPKQFAPQPGTGVMVNGKQGRDTNIFTKAKHGDVEARIEFNVPLGSNSGVYFQSRYEVQVFDSYGVKAPESSDCGGIYKRYNEKEGFGFEGHAPRVNASRPPGEWQTFDVIFRAPRFDKNGKKIEDAKFVKVVHNGKVVQENVTTSGPTRAAAFEDEQPLAPLMIQGDHGPVAYRNIRIKPIKLD